MWKRHPVLSICLLAVLLLANLGPAPALTPRAQAAPAASEMPLSQGKPSFASSSGCGDGGGCLSPDYANDGLDWTFWGAHTNVLPNYPHWWKVDLGATYTIGTLVADWYSSEFYPIQYRYRIEVSNDGETFTTVLDRTANTTTGQTVDRFSARGRWLRITIENGLLPDGSIGKDLSVYEFRVYQGGPLTLEVSDTRGEPVSALRLNDDGWASLNADGGAPANPITVTVTVVNTTGKLLTLHYNKITFNSPDNRVRFYVFSRPPEPECPDVRIEPPGSDTSFSHTRFESRCELALLPGESRQYRWGVWIQPSDLTTLAVSAQLIDGRDSSVVAQAPAGVQVPQAKIHPVLFLHGILGAMPPKPELLADAASVRQKLDPFLDSYSPLLDNLQKMGYEWNKTLFVLTYDWRQSNDISAAFLSQQLDSTVIPRSRPSQTLPYVSDQARADLIAHSMGGLVTRAYVQSNLYPNSDASGTPQGPLRKVILIASPHKGFPATYRTWEGMTWSDYLDDVPLLQGSRLLSLFMDEIVWPQLVLKHYQPTDQQIEVCRVYTGGPLPGIGNGIVPGSLAGSMFCPGDVIAAWAHDPVKGIKSLRQMLPTVVEGDPTLPYDPPAYLVEAGSGAAYPYPPAGPGYELNSWLEQLNHDIDRLKTRLGGAHNIYVIAGNGASQTDLQYKVSPPPGNGLWRHGTVAQEIPRPQGDDLIPINSATLNLSRLLDIPIQNEQVLDASPPSDQDTARHKQIMYQSAVQTTWVPYFLGVIQLANPDTPRSDEILPFKTAHTVPPWASAGNILDLFSVTSACPVNLLITDPLGRRLGYDPATGRVLREIPNAIYTAPGQEPQIVMISNPLTGTYQITATGYATGRYALRLDRTTAGGTALLDVFSGTTSAGQINTFTAVYTRSQSFPATSSLDDFNRADGPLGANWAGDIQEYEIQNQAVAPLGGSGALYWNSSFGADQEAHVTLSAIDLNADEIDLLLKGQGSGQCDLLEVWYQPSRGTVRVLTCHAGGAWVQHGADIPVSFQAGDQFGARAKADGTVEVYKNGALVGSVSIASSWPYRATGGRIGLWTIAAGTTRLDDFGGGSLPSSTPAPAVLDNFNQADGALGNAWTGATSGYSVQSRQMAAGTGGALYWNASFGADQEVFVTLSAIDANADEIDLLLKGQGSGGCEVLVAWYQPSRGTVQIWTCHDGGAWTQHGPDIPVTLQAGDQFSARARADGTVEVYKNGTLIGSVTIASSWPYRAGTGRIGVWTINASGTRLDDFGGGTLP